MPQLTPLELADGTIILVETTENVIPPVDVHTSSGEITRDTRGAMDMVTTNINRMEGTIRAFTSTTLEAFRQISAANVNKVTLEFGIKMGGEAGIPYVTKGTAESNLKITVECSFPNTE